MPASTPHSAPAWSAFRGWDEIRDSKENFKFDPDKRDVASFALQESADVRFRFQKAEESLAAGRFEEAMQPLQELINLYPNTLFQVAGTPGAGAGGTRSKSRWVGAGEYARFLLSRLPPAARAKYEEWARVRVAALESKPPYDSHDEVALATLGVRWPATAAGCDALERLGDLALERGAGEIAARWYERARLFRAARGDADPADVAKTEALTERASAASFLAGDAARAKALLGDDGAAQVARLSAAFTRTRAPAWPVFGGNSAHSRLGDFTDARPAFADRFEVDAVTDSIRNPYQSPSVLSQEFPIYPVAADDGFVVCDGFGVRAFSFFSSEPRWSFDGPELLVEDGGDFESLSSLLDGGDSIDREDSPVLGRCLQLSAAIERGVVVAPLLDAVPIGPGIHFDRRRIVQTIPTRSLFGIDLASGRMLWQQHRPERDRQDFENRVSVTAPPVIVSDRVIAAGYILEGALNCYAFCLSLADGRLLWKMPIVVGQQELTMFNKAFKEFTLQQPAERDGIAVVCSNLGVIAGIDSLSGEIRWVTAYDAIAIKGSVQWRSSNERQRLFDNAPPVIADGVVVCAPLDSSRIVALDLATGKWLWDVECRPNATSLIGVDGDVVVAVNSSVVAFHDLHTGRLLGTVPFGRAKDASPEGRGALAHGRLLQPLYNGLFDVQWTRRASSVDVTNAEIVNWGNDQPGNLLVYRDFALTASRAKVTVFFEADALIARAKARAAMPDATIDDRLRLADLRALRHDFDAAIADFTALASRTDVLPDRRRRIEDGLYRCHRDLALRAQAANDGAGFVSHLQSAADHAPDDTTFLSAADELLAFRRSSNDVAGYLQILDAIERRCPETPWHFRESEVGGDIAAGLFALDRRATIAVARGEFANAVLHWQHMLSRYHDRSIAEEPVARYASERIAQAIRDHGSDVYAVFEREAIERRDAALRARDAGALAKVIDEFPNSKVASASRLDLARMLLAKSDWNGVFAASSAILQGPADAATPELRAQALHLVAQAADGAGDRPLADLVWRRLGDVGKDFAVPGGDGATYGALAEARLARGDTIPEGDAPPWCGPDRMPALEGRVSSRRVDPSAWLVPIHGSSAPDFPDAIFLYEPELLTLIDVAADRELWHADVDAFFDEHDPITADAVAGRIIVRQQSRLRAFDRRDGRLLAEAELGQTPFFAFSGSGLLFYEVERADSGAELIAIEPTSLSMFWRVDLDLAGGIADARFCAGSILLLDHSGVLTAIDALTGAQAWSRTLSEITVHPEIAVFPEFGIALAVGGGSSGNWRALAFDAAHGTPLWSQSLAGTGSLSYASSSFVAAGDRLVALRGMSPMGRRPDNIGSVLVLEPLTGKVEREIPLAKPGRAFDTGPSTAGRRIALVESNANNRRQPRGADQLLVIDVGRDGDAAVQRVAIPELAQSLVDFDALPAGGDGIVGLISPSPRRGTRPADTLLFVADLPRADVRAVKISAERGQRRPQLAASRNSVVVLKDDQMQIFTAGDKR